MADAVLAAAPAPAFDVSHLGARHVEFDAIAKPYLVTGAGVRTLAPETVGQLRSWYLDPQSVMTSRALHEQLARFIGLPDGQHLAPAPLAAAPISSRRAVEPSFTSFELPAGFVEPKFYDDKALLPVVPTKAKKAKTAEAVGPSGKRHRERWSAEEDDLLRELQAIIRAHEARGGTRVSWALVADTFFAERNSSQLKQHFRYMADKPADGAAYDDLLRAWQAVLRRDLASGAIRTVDALDAASLKQLLLHFRATVNRSKLCVARSHRPS